MTIEPSKFLTLSLLVGSISLVACSDDGTTADASETSSETGSETGDGDGDPATASGDGDGDSAGDGDGDSAGDGDGDSAGDGDGDSAGDGDGDSAGDGDGDSAGDGDGDPLPPPGGEVRVMHGAPDAPPVDVYVEGLPDPVIEGLTYAQSSGFLPVPEGEFNFQVYPAGAEPIADNLVIETGPVMIELDGRYTVLARGLLAPEEGDGEFGLDLYVEGFEAVAEETVRARIVHAGADAPTVDLDVYDALSEGACAGELEIEGFERFTDTGEAGVELPAVDGLNLAVCFEGQAVRTFTLDLAALAGAELFVFADGLLGVPLGRAFDAFQLLAIGPDTVGDAISIRRDPFFYALHAVPDVGRVDVCINGNPVGPLQNLDFADMIGPFRIATNDGAPLAIHPDAGGQQCAGEGVPFPVMGDAMVRGTTNIITAAGALSLDNISQEIYEEGLALDDPDNVRVQAVHLSPDTPEVDVGADGVGFGVWTDLVYPSASDPAGASLAPGSYDVQAGVSMAMGEDADVAAVLFDTLDLSQAAGARAIAMVTGMLAPPNNNAEGLSLFVIVTSNQGDFGWQVGQLFPQ